MADPDKYCIKAEEIGKIKNEQLHLSKYQDELKDSIKSIDDNVDKILQKLNNGITETMAALSKTVSEQGKKINKLESYGGDFRPTKSRKSDMKNMNLWKKAGIIMSGITLFLAFAYSIGNLLIFVGNILQGLPK